MNPDAASAPGFTSQLSHDYLLEYNPSSITSRNSIKKPHLDSTVRPSGSTDI
jgi:hypothetical protein